MYIVLYCMNDYCDIWRREEAKFSTEKEAEDYVESSTACIGDWYEIIYSSE